MVNIEHVQLKHGDIMSCQTGCAFIKHAHTVKPLVTTTPRSLWATKTIVPHLWDLMRPISC